MFKKIDVKNIISPPHSLKISRFTFYTMNFFVKLSKLSEKVYAYSSMINLLLSTENGVQEFKILQPKFYLTL